MKVTKKIISYPNEWADKLKELAKDNLTDTTKEIRIAIRTHLIQNGKL